ncbi:DNA-binding protein [Polaromonas sp. P1-6]|nr:DNA-binding protein [Polaromonas sp. P1-6]
MRQTSGGLAEGREELGNTGSKSTIHRYLKEIEEEEGPAAGTRVAVSEAIQDLVGRLAARVNEEAEERVTAAQAKHAEQLAQQQQAAAALKTEAQSTRQQLEQTQRALAEEKTAHGKTSEALSSKTLECTQLAQQVADLLEASRPKNAIANPWKKSTSMRARRWSISGNPPRSSATRTSASTSSRCSTCRPSCAP